MTSSPIYLLPRAVEVHPFLPASLSLHVFRWAFIEASHAQFHVRSIRHQKTPPSHANTGGFNRDDRLNPRCTERFLSGVSWCDQRSALRNHEATFQPEPREKSLFYVIPKHFSTATNTSTILATSYLSPVAVLGILFLVHRYMLHSVSRLNTVPIMVVRVHPPVEASGTAAGDASARGLFHGLERREARGVGW